MSGLTRDAARCSCTRDGEGWTERQGCPVHDVSARSADDDGLLTAQALGDLRTDLADLAENPLTYGQETHGELHADALKTLDALLAREEAERARREEAEVALTAIRALQPNAVEYIRANGFVFDSIGTEEANWQHLAFSLYTDLCQAESLAAGVLDDLLAGGASEEPA